MPITEALAWLPETAGTENGVVTDAEDEKAAWETAARAIIAEKGGELSSGVAARFGASTGVGALMVCHLLRDFEFPAVLKYSVMAVA